MSTIRKIPFIESVLSGLSKGLLNNLKAILDSNESNIELGFGNLPTINTITPTNFKLDVNNKKSGILIYTSDICVLIAYHRFQDLQLFKLNVSNSTYEKVNEYCDINELRRILDDSLETVGENILNIETSSGELEDSDIEALKLPNAAIEYNDTIYYKDTQDDNEIVFKALPRVDDDTTYLDVITIDLSDNTYTLLTSAIAAGEGFTPEYDTELSNSSTNAVQNKTIVEALEDYAKKDGNYPTMTVGVADNLAPYSEDSGAEQSKPFIAQGTGTDNNTAIVTTGALGLLKEKQGNTVVVNQLINKANLPSTQTLANGVVFTNNGDGTFSLSGTANADIDFNLTTFTLKANIKYIYFGANGANDNVYLELFGSGNSYKNKGNNVIISRNDDLYVLNRLHIASGTTVNQKFRPCITNLTQMFNGNIPQDLLDNPSHFSWHYNGSLAYNTGSLENANGVKLVCTQGRNLLGDEDVLINTAMLTDGTTYSADGFITSKLIRVIPNRKCIIYCTTFSGSNGCSIATFDAQGNNNGYFDKVLYSGLGIVGDYAIEIPSNVWYIKFFFHYSSGAMSSYNNDITVSLYYTPEQGGEGYNQHYPYIASKIYDTGSEILKSAGNAKDTKTPDGAITRRIKIYTFTGNENWVQSSHCYIMQEELPNVKLPSDPNYYWKANILFAKLITSSWQTLSDGSHTSGIALTFDEGKVVISENDYANISALTGTELYYEATPTTEQGATFPENLEISDYGMMYWLDGNDNLVGISQGAKFFYPVDYKGFIDDVYSRTNGDAQDLVVQSDLSPLTSQDNILLNAIGGTLRQCLCVKESLTFNNTKVVDMGDLNYTYDSTYQAFRPTNLSDNAPVGDRTHSIVLSTLYETVDAMYSSLLGNLSNMCMCQTLDSSGTSPNIWIKNTAYTDATAFKAAMKGVLLAYEKASE